MSQTVAIVLGAMVLPGGQDSPALRRRAEHAAALWHQGRVQGIIASGRGETWRPSQASVIGEICRDAGVPEDALRLEAQSQNTRENLQNAFAMLSPEDRPLIVTDGYHAPRARLVARQLGRPADTSSPGLKGAPHGKVLRAALREIPAYIAYFLRLR